MPTEQEVTFFRYATQLLLHSGDVRFNPKNVTMNFDKYQLWWKIIDDPQFCRNASRRDKNEYKRAMSFIAQELSAKMYCFSQTERLTLQFWARRVCAIRDGQSSFYPVKDPGHQTTRGDWRILYCTVFGDYYHRQDHQYINDSQLDAWVAQRMETKCFNCTLV